MPISEERKAYREANREVLLEKQRARNAAHYQANKDAYKNRSKAWREANPVKYREATKRHAEENRLKVMERSRQWYMENLERAKVTSRKNKLARYGLTMEAFDEMFQAQRGECLICQDVMSKPAVDHCHASGKVRGLLCRKCNSALGLLKDCPETIRRAAEYLIRSSSGAISTPNKMP